MSANYFNSWEFKQALHLSKHNPMEAKLKYEEYLSKYPLDYSAYPYYASILITLGQLDKAEDVLDYVEMAYKNDENYFKDIKGIRILESNLASTRIRLLSYLEEYEELYEFYLNHLDIVKNKDINHILFYCKKKLGLLSRDRKDTYKYVFRQIVNYEENDFLNYINKHLSNSNEEVVKLNRSMFVPEFPIREVIDEVRKYIPSSKRLYCGFYEDLYVFKYNECGRDNNKLVNHFRVICFHNTSDIITMFPDKKCEYLESVDLNYMVPTKENVLVKRKSQIDKFNERYNRR